MLKKFSSRKMKGLLDLHSFPSNFRLCPRFFTLRQDLETKFECQNFFENHSLKESVPSFLSAFCPRRIRIYLGAKNLCLQRIYLKIDEIESFRTKRMVLVVILFSILYNISRFFEYNHERVVSWQDEVTEWVNTLKENHNQQRRA